MKHALIWALAQLYRTAPGVEIAHLNQPKWSTLHVAPPLREINHPGAHGASISTDPGALAAPHFFK
jgi:hypothetical protein